MEKITLTIHNKLSIVNDDNNEHKVKATIQLYNRSNNGKNDANGDREPIRSCTVVIPPKDSRDVEIDPDYDFAHLTLKTSSILARGDRKGVKVIPGTKLGTTHYFESEIIENEFRAIIHYEKKENDNGPRETHEDPEVHHPVLGSG